MNNNDRLEVAPQLVGSPAPEPLHEELYAALRAAGASPEDAEHCCEEAQAAAE